MHQKKGKKKEEWGQIKAFKAFDKTDVLDYVFFFLKKSIHESI